MNDPDIHAPVIMFVDDEANAVKYFQRAIGSLAPVATAGSVEEGKRVLDAHADTICVLVSDQRMPGAYGNELLFYARDRYPHIVRILTTAYSELEHTVEAVNQGQIHRYIQKPWEITALRMELKQALDLAKLRWDHAQLLREKLLIRQKQTVSNRIGSVYTLCASLAGAEHFLPVEAYLAAAYTAGVTAPEPDWLVMDYADLISAEAFRSGAFGRAVREQLAQIEQRHPDLGVAPAISMLAAVFGATFEAGGADSGVFCDTSQLSEFLETPTLGQVSAQHAFWLACLLWLGKRGWSVNTARTERGLQCTLAKVDLPVTPKQLAAWVEQF